MGVLRIAAKDLPNSEYHKPLFKKKRYFSSSQLKTMLQDPQLFHSKYILGENEALKQSDALVIGSYYHAGVLEPHLLGEEFAIYGKVRRGSEWDKFRQANEGKDILTEKNLEVAEALIQTTLKNERVNELLLNGEPEVSFFGNLCGLPAKIRFDFFGFDGYGLDLKSTGKNARSVYDIQSSVEAFNYDMSAAMYMDLFNVWAEENGARKMTEFFWPFASKTMNNCQVYRAALDSDLIEVGRRKYQRAIELIKEHSENNWAFPDTVEELAPIRYVSDNWLTERPKKEVTKHPKKQPAPKSELEDLL